MKLSILSIAAIVTVFAAALSPGRALGEEGTEASIAQKDKVVTVDEVVVTAPRIKEPLTVVTDPKAPRQPVPAADGGDFLKSIPGFSVIRKGGVSGDPVLRGGAGSRVTVLLDGGLLFGGCGGRMDPPTSYAYPELYDRVTVIKGPETVLYGPGNTSGVVMFEKEDKHLDGPAVKFNASLMGGSFDRRDAIADVLAGTKSFYVEATGSQSSSDDYKDGNGNSVHSSYKRWSGNGVVGWTPDKNTVLELSGIRGNGEAAYADRTMDGSKFERSNVGLKFEKKHISSFVEKLEAQAYYNYANHVMDNYSLRANTGVNLAMNVDQRVRGYRLASTLALGEQTRLVAGVDSAQSRHHYRDSTFKFKNTPEEATNSYLSKGWIEDMRINQLGAFAELSSFLTPDNKMLAGLRVDKHDATDGAYCLGLPDAAGTGCQFPSGIMSDSRGKTHSETLPSGFVRYENVSNKLYVGLGHTERFPDYWELSRNEEVIDDTGKNVAGNSVFMKVKPEKTTQLDAGLNWEAGPVFGSVAAFYGKSTDYIIIHWLDTGAGTALNIDATIWGGEADLTYAITNTWKTIATLACVHGEDDTNNRPLPQQPPLEFRLSTEYDNHEFSFGALWRLVSDQERYAEHYGNIVMNGVDTGRTGGFGVFSVNMGWKATKNLQLTAGVDNVFDKAYAEHLSRTNASLDGYVAPSGVKINEPGRNIWVKLAANF
ncbi:MAG: TonB-dependent copper receptor [Nitrospirae bacterium]|nr:TonB-dependent copper receptor [Nitrospirota bacterium]